MLPMPQIHRISPSRVVHELILKPIGTYLVRSATENDDILSQIQIQANTNVNPYVVLSVRVDENKYHRPIMNYRLPPVESNDQEDSKDLLEYYQDKSKTIVLPDLKEECNIKTDDTNWKIDASFVQTSYSYVYQPSDNGINGEIQYNNHDIIKVFKKPMKNDKHELTLLQNLSYFHIITFYGISCESNHIKHLIFADHGESLQNKYLNGLMSKELSMIGYQTACGMMYLESKHIIHRNLHVGNIFIDENYFIRIANFKYAVIRDNDENEFQRSIDNSELKFQKRLLAPECFPQPPANGEMLDPDEILWDEFSSKSDMWAYGLIFIDLTINADEQIYPYLSANSNTDGEIGQLVQHIKVDRQIYRRPNGCPEKLYNVLKRCWEYCPDDRISFMDIRNEMLRLLQSTEN